MRVTIASGLSLHSLCPFRLYVYRAKMLVFFIPMSFGPRTHHPTLCTKRCEIDWTREGKKPFSSEFLVRSSLGKSTHNRLPDTHTLDSTIFFLSETSKVCQNWGWILVLKNSLFHFSALLSLWAYLCVYSCNHPSVCPKLTFKWLKLYKYFTKKVA